MHKKLEIVHFKNEVWTRGVNDVTETNKRGKFRPSHNEESSKKLFVYGINTKCKKHKELVVINYGIKQQIRVWDSMHKVFYSVVIVIIVHKKETFMESNLYKRIQSIH